MDSTLRAVVDTGAAGDSKGTSSVRLQRRHFSSTPPGTTRASKLPHMQRQSASGGSESAVPQVAVVGWVCVTSETPEQRHHPHVSENENHIHFQYEPYRLDRASVNRPGELHRHRTMGIRSLIRNVEVF